jgi:glycogen debranching enzyme
MITSIDQLFSELPDLSHEVPYKLMPNEKVISVEHCPQPRPEKPIDGDRELARIFKVDRVDEIGKNGPAVAAIAMEGSENDAGQGLFSEGHFSRDAFFAGLFMHKRYPRALEAPLVVYASLMGVKDDPDTLEEPGKWHHENWPMSHPHAQKVLKETGWKEFPTYMACDTTALAIIGLGVYCQESPEGIDFLRRTRYIGKDGKEHNLHHALKESVACLERQLDQNEEGFLSYKMTNPRAHINPTMPDSQDSMFDRKGRLPNFPGGVATAHDQGLAYDALIHAVRLFRQSGMLDEAKRLYIRAAKLRQSFFEHMWVKRGKEGFFAAGVHWLENGKIEPLEVRKAIAFFPLNSAILDPNDPEMERMAEMAVRTLFGKDMLAAGGFRSCAMGEPRYLPCGYHDGNVWQFMNVWIAQGLRRFGWHALGLVAEELTKKVIQETRMLPEYVRGGKEAAILLNERIVDTVNLDDWKYFAKLGVARADKPWTNRREQPAQQVQLWTAAANKAIDIQWAEGQLPKGYRYKPFEEEILSTVSS